MAIAAVEELVTEFGEGFSGSVIVPASLKYQWKNFISQFTGGLLEEATGQWHGGAPCIMVDGPTEKRDALYKRIYNEHPTYSIISYNQVVGDYSLVDKMPWDYAIADEVTAIKGFDSDRTQALKTFTPEFRFGLTGDAVENSPEELFCIMEWIDPSVLGGWEYFDKTYCIRHPTRGFLIKAKNLDVLHQVMNNAQAWVIKRASEPDVAPYMPKRREPITWYVPLDEDSAELYDVIADELLIDLAEMSRQGAGHFDVAMMYSGGKGSKAAHGRAAAKLMSLRMLCADPYVLRQSARRYMNAVDKPPKLTAITTADGRRIKVMKSPPKPGSAYAASLMQAGWLHDLQRHPKMDRVVRGIDALLSENEDNKIVVFSYFKDVLAWLGAQYQGEYVIHNGDMSAKKKDEAKRQFQTDPTTRLFLSSDSGAYGVDLPQANYLINYDTPFSAGTKRQRDARVIRGSSLDYWTHIQIINVLVHGTIEEHYSDKTTRKMELGEAIKSGRTSTEVKMTAMSLSAFIEMHDVHL